jgi:hypothetical protein
MTMMQRLDGFVNVLSGLGAALSKGSNIQISTPDYLTSEQLAALYDSVWLARRAVDVLPATALNRGVRADDSALERFEEINQTDEHPNGAVLYGLQQGRLFGGAAIVMGFAGGRSLLEPPGERETLAWLDVVSREQLVAVQVDEDPTSATYKRGVTWRITGGHRRAGTEVHRDRLIFCEGLPSAAHTSAGAWTHWSGAPEWISVLQPLHEILGQYGIAWEAISELVQETSIGVMQMAGVLEMVSEKDQTTIQNRLRMLSTGRSVAKTILLDAEHGESFTRTPVSFTDLPQLMSQFAQQIAGATGTPLTVLFGISPSGLNATGESDLRQYYETVTRYQNQSVLRKIRRIFEHIDPSAEVTIPPVWEPTAKEQAEIRKAAAEGDRTWYDMGVLEPSEIRQSRSTDGSLGIEIDPNLMIPTPPPPTLPEPEIESDPDDEDTPE